MAADLELLDEIYTFCMERAKAKRAGLEGRRDWEERKSAESTIKLLASIRQDIRERPWGAIAGIDYFRQYAMRDKDHPDFKPEWTME